MPSPRLSRLFAVAFLACASWTAAQVPDTLISNYAQPNAGTNGNLSEMTQRIAWDFTTGADAYNDLMLTLKVSNNQRGFNSIGAEFYTSNAGVPDALVGSVDVFVRFTEGSFQDFNSNISTFGLAANTTYWVVLSLGSPLAIPSPTGLLLRQEANGATDAGSLYSSVPGTGLLVSTDGGSTWTVSNGVDAVKYILEGMKAAVVLPVVPEDALRTAESLQNMALQSTSVLLEDFAMRLYRARTGGGSSSGDSVVVNLGGEDELVVLGEGDGPDATARQVGLRTGGTAGQLRVFSTFDYGYADLTSRAASQRTDTYAGSLGMELNLTDHLAVGGGIGALSAQTRLAGGIATVDTEGLTLAGYTTYQRGGVYVDALYAATLLDHEVTRGAALSNPESTVHSVQFNTGYNFTRGILTHGPFLGLNYAHATTDAYTESGPGAVSVGRQNSDTLLGRVGWQASARFQRGWGVIVPQFRLSWDNQYVNDLGTADVALVGVPGVVARTGTSGVRQNGLGVGAGVLFQFTHGWAATLNYQGHVLDKGLNSHSATAFVSYRW